MEKWFIENILFKQYHEVQGLLNDRGITYTEAWNGSHCTITIKALG